MLNLLEAALIFPVNVTFLFHCFVNSLYYLFYGTYPFLTCLFVICAHVSSLQLNSKFLKDKINIWYPFARNTMKKYSTWEMLDMLVGPTNKWMNAWLQGHFLCRGPTCRDCGFSTLLWKSRKEGPFKRCCLNEKQKRSVEQEIEVVQGTTEDPEVGVWNNDEHLLREFRKNRLEFWRIT